MICGGPVTLTYGYYRNRLSYQSRSTYILYALFMVSGAANVYKTKGKNTKTIYEVWSNVRCGGQLNPEVLFRLRGLGLWPNNPVRGREYIRGQSVKEEMKIVLWEEVKYIYGGPNCIRGEYSSRNFCPRWLETSPSP